MTSYTFTIPPPGQGPFTFSPTLDGQSYTAIVTWNAFGQRWYISLYSGASPDPVFTQPVIGSPSGIPIQGLAWADGLATVTTQEPHGYALASTLQLTIYGCGP